MRKSFANTIRAAIRSAPMTQAELARRLDVTEATVSAFVNGRQWMGEELIDKLARVLGLKVVVDPPRSKERKSSR